MCSVRASEQTTTVEFRGGAAIDRGFGHGPRHADSDPDVIDTGGGFDEVTVGDGGPLADVVRTGDDGRLFVDASRLTDDAVLSGSGGATLLIRAGAPEDLWRIDNAARTAAVGGAERFWWSGFDRLVWERGLVDFLGTDRDEHVAARLVRASLGGGDDRMIAWAGVDTGPVGVVPVDGGAGDDEAWFTDPDGFVGGNHPRAALDIEVDVAATTARGRRGESGLRWSMSNVESYGATTAGAAVLRGGDGADTLTGFACDLRITGGAGDDVLRGEPAAGAHYGDTLGCYVSDVRTRLVGGAGADRLVGGQVAEKLVGGAGSDRLVGGRGHDVLLGGPGRDHAFGGRGTDRCVAEVRRSC